MNNIIKKLSRSNSSNSLKPNSFASNNFTYSYTFSYGQKIINSQ